MGAATTTDRAVYLSPEHREMLAASGVDPNVAEERGYRTVSAQEARLAGFSGRQGRAGLSIPMISPDGEVHYQLRPDEPRAGKDGKPIKYETVAGQPHHIDVHPRCFDEVLEGYGPLYIVEGAKKGDCLVSLGEAAVVLTGVWMWGRKRQRGGAKYGRPELLSDWDPISLEGREVRIAFDSDFRRKRGVALALMRLAERLQERGAKVCIASWPEEAGKGIDDFLAGGGSLDDLDVSPFTPGDLTPYVAHEDRRVLGAVEATRRKMARDQWFGMAGATSHSALMAHLEVATERGRIDEQGRLMWVCSSRELMQRAGIGSNRTASKADHRLEERGYLKKVPGDTRRGKANTYVLEIARGCYTSRRGEGKNPYYPTTVAPSCNFAPHLRWSSPAPSEDDPHAPVGDPFGRLGKGVELALMRLMEWGGSGTLGDLSRATGANHTSNLRKRLEPLEDACVLELPPKGKHRGVVKLADDWRKKLDGYRELDGEIAAGRRQAVKHRAERLAYELRHELKAGEVPELRGAEAVGEAIGKQASRDATARIEAERRKVGITPATFLTDALSEVSAVRWRELRERWQEAGGNAEALRLAVMDGPFRFRREDLDFGKLYVGRAAPAEAPAPPVEEEPDWRDHSLDCECDECSCTPPSYWRAWEPVMSAA